MRYKNSKSKAPSPKLQGIQRSLLVFGLWSLAFGLSLQSLASTPATLLDSANNTYSKNNFEKASHYYEQILASGYESAEVYFNLGNTYYKLDNLGKSILNYERAKKITPHDEDLNFNLKLANQRTLDKIEPAPKLFLDEWWDNIKSMQSERTWGMRSIVSFALFLFFLGVFITSDKLFTKQLGFWLWIIFFSFSVFSFFITKSKHNDLSEQNAAVILSSSAEIKNAPANSGTKLFILHEGTLVSTPGIISNPEGDWVMVKVSPEKAGWVKRSSLEFI